ncbi:cyclopropane-fatty-acyl-phospholipid synthase family protein [Methylotenera sp.]|uniref:SAM-dependent methyltransferase n=1 Tax=Methylotenera sp. TaxID=2051956 RepID=UPI0027277DC9|nr:cyclopropane-fatty-acyl-phospholipid synthase family protein [Methylotenera sp.]MDO9205562.1 cyclopropane-fatty-acyl-phospholipid synthase family protein [Methylotenera sp.]
MQLTSLAIQLAEKSLIPDYLIRQGISNLSEKRLQEIHADNCEKGIERLSAFVSAMNNAPIALVPELANAQHYELPTKFFELCLGVHRKYSSCFWLPETKTLDEAEANALALTCEHADLHNGQNILELGCGWGSLTLWMAERYLGSTITAVSNSNSQREHIMAMAKTRGLTNVRVITCDMNKFNPAEYDINSHFDRVVSVEMFEHMRNYKVLYNRIHDWLAPSGKFMMHIFVHRNTPYLFEVQGDDDWMSQFFFSGGMMPSDDLPLHFQDDLKLSKRWRWDGTHYEKTANAWLENMDKHREEIDAILKETYGLESAEKWRNRWRIFYMACAELFGYKHGQEWWVTHYQFERRL